MHAHDHVKKAGTVIELYYFPLDSHIHTVYIHGQTAAC